MKARTTPGAASGLVATLTLLLTACGGTDPVPAPPGFDLALSGASVILERGAAADLSVDLDRAAGFADAVTLSLAGAPAGMIAVFDPNPATGGSSTLRLEAGDAVATGEHAVTVRGAAGSAREEALLRVNVTAASTAPDYVFALEPAAVTAERGSSVEAAVALQRRGGFDAEVGVLLVDAPTGVTLAPLFVPAGSSRADLTLRIGDVAPGAYDLVFEAWGAGIRREARLALTVADGGTDPGPDPGDPVGESRMFLIDPDDARNTTDPTVEVDGDGGVHALYPARMLGDAVYAYCPAGCAGPEAVAYVELPTDGTVDDAMLALDGEGRPHALLATYQRVYYATCDGDCTREASWTVSPVLEHASGAEREVTGEAFALDPQGRPRFVMHTFRSLAPVGGADPQTFYALCDAACHVPASWSVHAIADAVYQESQLRFDAAGTAHLATVATLDGQGDMGAYLACAAGCTGPDGWVGTTLVQAFSDRFVSGIEPAISMALTGEGAPRVVQLGVDEGGVRKIVYLACDAACEDGGEAWGLQVLLDGDTLGAGLDLALDGRGLPSFVYTADHNVMLASCERDCLASADGWGLEDVERTSDLAADPVVPYFNCSVSAWFFRNPSLALGADGTTHVAFQALDVSGPFGEPDPAHPACGAGPDMMFARYVRPAR